MSEGQKSNPKVLYHYTSIDSFKNVVREGRIRATRYDQMNDTSEITLGAERLLEAVTAHEVNDDLREYKKFLIQAIDDYRQNTLEVYVLSFSAVEDSLEQWRAYAKNGGVAIGFDFEKVQKGFLVDITRRVGGQEVANPMRPDCDNRLTPCEYTDKNGQLDLQAIVRERFFREKSLPAIFRAAKSNAVALAFLAPCLGLAVYQTICCVKHGAYRLEEEWRSVNWGPDSTDYPVRLSETNRMYIEMKFDPKEFIKEVWVSPHGDKIGCERAAAYLRQEHELSFEIKRSRIPFRG
jgi:hypothetical protein